MGVFEALEPEDPRRVGRYRITARLGSGGMGQVYLARSPGGRPVAVKVVRPELAGDGGFRLRFAREVTAARRVNGAFTAGVVDADPDGTPAWLATVYVPGLSLGEAIAGHGHWPAQSVLALGAGLAEALEAIHAAGVVHRDLKPSNVLLAADGPRVIDFGISVASEASALTSTGMVIGTPGFMSPEQLTGRPVGPASDVFALGAVLAYTATGVGPFGTGSPHALHFRAVYEQPNLAPLPPELRPVVAACLAKQPDQRPTVASLLDRLTAADGGDEGGETAAVTLLLTEPGWMPDQIARLVREHTSTSLPHTPHPPLPKTPPASPATTQPASDIPAPAPPEASLPPYAEPPHPDPPAPPAAPAPTPKARQIPTEAGDQHGPVPPSPAPDTSESDSAERPTGAIYLARKRALVDPLNAPEPGLKHEPEPHRRWKLPLLAALGVALTVVAIPVIASLRGGADSDSKGGKAAGIEQTSSSHSSSPSATETVKVKPPNFVKLPAPCKALSETTIERLVPGVKNRDGTVIKKTDTTSPETCWWNGLEEDGQYRWLHVGLWRYGSGSALDSGEKHAKDTYAQAVADAQADEGAQNVKTEPRSGIGDQATAVSYDSTVDGDVVKEATLVVRTGNAVVELHHSGAGFAGAATPDAATIMRGATTAAEEVVESVANANK